MLIDVLCAYLGFFVRSAVSIATKESMHVVD